MADCCEVKVGEVYSCEKCELEVQVVRECQEVSASSEECDCTPCSLVCCGEGLKKKG